jgi:phosphoglycerate dehydrogenase-like enzyme
VAGSERKPVVLVGGNMGRNDGVDYSEWFARDFPDVTFYSTEGKPEVLERHIAEADAVIGDVPERLLARATRLRWVSSTGAGANGVSTPAFQARPEIIATTVVGVHAASVPEQTLAMLLAFARRLPEQILNQHGPHRFYWPTGMFEIEGQTMGILGLGKIGTSLARKAKGLGMRVTGWRRSDTPAPAGLLDRQFAPDDLHGMLADADHVVVTLPLTAETHHRFGTAEFAAMKRSAYFFNVGRGPIVDQAALLAALKGGTIAGAGIDVTDPEPLPPDDPLWDVPNLILLTHYGGLTPKYGPRAYAILSANLRRFLTGEPLMNVVDKQRGY